MALSDMSISRIASFSRLKIVRIGIEESLCFSSLKASSQSCNYMKVMSFRVNLVRGDVS
jgi:hypothetical protein